MELKKYTMSYENLYGIEHEIKEDGEWYKVENVQSIFLVKDEKIRKLKEDVEDLLAVIPELQRIKAGYSKVIVQNILMHGRKNKKEVVKLKLKLLPKDFWAGLGDSLK